MKVLCLKILINNLKLKLTTITNLLYNQNTVFLDDNVDPNTAQLNLIKADSNYFKPYIISPMFFAYSRIAKTFNTIIINLDGKNQGLQPEYATFKVYNNTSITTKVNQTLCLSFYSRGDKTNFVKLMGNL